MDPVELPSNINYTGTSVILVMVKRGQLRAQTSVRDNTWKTPSVPSVLVKTIITLVEMVACAVGGERYAAKHTVRSCKCVCAGVLRPGSI